MIARMRLTVVLVLVATTANAAAQDQGATAASPQPDEEARRGQARLHFERGNGLMDVEDWDGAILEFERSLELHPTRAALFNLANCLEAVRAYRHAIGAYVRFLHEYRDAARPEELQRVAERLQRLRSLVAEIAVNVNVPGAEILVDGESVGTAPLVEPVQVGPGRHAFEARAEGYATAQRVVPVASGDRVTIDLTLTEIARVGGLRVEANVPGAEVWVDGALMGAAPYRGEMAEGEHEIRVAAPGYADHVQTISVATGDERIVTVTLAEPGGTHPAWFWSMVGLTGAAAVATAALGAVVLVKDDDYANDQGRTVEMQDEGKRLVIATDVSLGIAVASAIAATVLAFTTAWGGDEEARPAASTPRVDVAGSIGAADGGAAVFLIGRF